MLVPISWLREFVPYEGTAQALGDKLTMLGLELENIVNPFEAIAGIITGYVAKCQPHPDSDHLHCCKVDIGSGQLLDIVCGAPNVASGQKVAVAPVGCRLPDGMVIKKAKLRGQPSQGMICSERELGLSQDHTGILVLPESVAIGRPLVEALEMDVEVLDISITPNRADCLSILGMARETAMAFNLPFNVPELPLLAMPEAGAAIAIRVDDPDLCPLYSGRAIMNVQSGPAPMRMRYRLIAAGMRPISNVVDATNYIMLECGQPLHAFALDKIEGGEIIVKTGAAGEKFTTLDGKERVLDAADIRICDARKTIALAGVMGGLNSEMLAQSHDVFLESAIFNPRRIRKTSRRLGLATEASYRFERGVDQNRALWSLDRASALIASISGGMPSSTLCCQEPRPFVGAKISYHPARASHLLGEKIADDFQSSTLEKIGCAITAKTGNEWLVDQPSWRPDLTREADLIEEVGRVYGLDAIEPVLPALRRKLNDNLVPSGKYHFWQKIRHWGAGLGLNEAINYSFTGAADLDFLNLPADGRVRIFNPLSEEQDTLRTSLAPGLLKDLSNNLAYGEQSVRLFELANKFFAAEDSESGVREQGALAILLYGLRHEAGWPRPERDFDYADIKGVCESLLALLHIDKAAFTNAPKHPFLSPCAALAVQGKNLGFLGRVRPEAARAYNAQKDAWYCEIDLENLESVAAAVDFHPAPVYPPSRRDITVSARPGITAAEILDTILMVKTPLLEGAILLDCYQPDGAEERNLTFRLTFRHPARTLKDAEVDKEREKIASALAAKPGLKV